LTLKSETRIRVVDDAGNPLQVDVLAAERLRLMPEALVVVAVPRTVTELASPGGLSR
jgi:hypothetical protein